MHEVARRLFPSSFLISAAFLVPAGLLAGCGDAAGPDGPEETPTYQVFAAGACNVILGYDGEAWRLVTEEPGGRYHAAAWGTSATDVYFLHRSGAVHFDGESLTDRTTGWEERVGAWHMDLWGTGTDLWGVAYGHRVTTIRHWDGSEWGRALDPDPPTDFWGIWASAPDDVFAVGEWFRGDTPWLPVVWHFDGARWDTMPLGFDQRVWLGPRLWAVWGASPTDVFAVGTAGFFHYDGTAWTRFETEFGDSVYPPPDPRTVHGTSASDVFAADTRGYIYHYDGASWTLIAETGELVLDLWAVAPDDVYAVGDSILHYDGDSWTAMDMPVSCRLRSVWAPSP